MTESDRPRGDMEGNFPRAPLSVQIVAVTFVKLGSNYKLRFEETKPYFYLDALHLSVGDLALAHNGSEFAVVRVARIIDTSEAAAAEKVTKPLLCRVDYDEALISDCRKRIDEFKDKAIDSMIQHNIDVELGKVYDNGGKPILKGRHRLTLNPAAKRQYEHGPDYGYGYAADKWDDNNE